jgi:hypothetical protein
MKFTIVSFLGLTIALQAFSQDRWQQRAEYIMDVRLDVKTHKVTRSQARKNSRTITIQKIHLTRSTIIFISMPFNPAA